MGFATFQYGEHVDNLKDTHNWYVKVLVETGIVGLIIALFLLQQLLAISYRLFKTRDRPALSRSWPRSLSCDLLLSSLRIALAIDGPILKLPDFCGSSVELRFARLQLKERRNRR